MAEVLSQQEIDQLLTDINTGEIKQEQMPVYEGQEDVSVYDFRRPNRVSKDQLKTIKTLHENYSEIFGFYLASKLQTLATIDLISVDQLRYSEYVLSISNPSCIYIFDIEETEGKAVIELTPELVLVIVERLLGGSGAKVNTNRTITTIEQRMIKPLMSQALNSLSSAWNPIQKLTFKLSGFESNPDFVQIAPASEIVIVIAFEIKIGEEKFLMNLCYPSFALEEVIAKLNIQFYSTVNSNRNKNKTQEKIASHLNRTDLILRVILGKTQISIQDLLNLENGDVLVLDSFIDQDLPIYVKDRLKFYGRPGLVDGNVAMKVNRLMDEE